MLSSSVGNDEQCLLDVFGPMRPTRLSVTSVVVRGCEIAPPAAEAVAGAGDDICC